MPKRNQSCLVDMASEVIMNGFEDSMETSDIIRKALQLKIPTSQIMPSQMKRQNQLKKMCKRNVLSTKKCVLEVIGQQTAKGVYLRCVIAWDKFSPSSTFLSGQHQTAK